MKRTNYLWLYLIGVIFQLIIASIQQSPGYMDADYYFAGGLQLAQGKGFYEPFIWNYLAEPAGIPNPSHTYWMPLPSILAFIGLLFDIQNRFFFSRMVFVILSGLIPGLSAALAYSYRKRSIDGWLGGGLALFSGFYLNYLSLPETFSLYLLLGTLFLILGVGYPVEFFRFAKISSNLRFLCLGCVAGLMHLTRADGLLFALIGFAICLFYIRKYNQILTGWKNIIAFLSGYLLFMGPWYVRNLYIFGALFPPGGTTALWLTNYDQLFSYPSRMINIQTWLDSGWSNIVADRLASLSSNLKTALAVQMNIFLFPLVLVGVWSRRKESIIQLGLFTWVLLLVIMTVVFPYAGSRGGFFHSGSCAQVLFWSVVPAGLEKFIDLGVRLRKWNYRQSTKFFSASLIVLSFGLSFYLFSSRVIGGDLHEPIWDSSYRQYMAVEAEMKRLGAKPHERVLVNNSPGYYIAARRESLSIPNGGVDNQFEVAKRYTIQYLILEKNHVNYLDTLYELPENQLGLSLLSEIDGTYIYKFIKKENQ